MAWRATRCQMGAVGERLRRLRRCCGYFRDPAKNAQNNRNGLGDAAGAAAADGASTNLRTFHGPGSFDSASAASTCARLMATEMGELVGETTRLGPDLSESLLSRDNFAPNLNM